MSDLKITKPMIDCLNLQLEKEGSVLRYVKKSEDIIDIYQVIVQDKFVDNEYAPSPNLTKEFEQFVRDFFKQYDVENTGFSNTVRTLDVYK